MLIKYFWQSHMVECSGRALVAQSIRPRGYHNISEQAYFISAKWGLNSHEHCVYHIKCPILLRLFNIMLRVILILEFLECLGRALIDQSIRPAGYHTISEQAYFISAKWGLNFHEHCVYHIKCPILLRLFNMMLCVISILEFSGSRII